MPYLYPSNIPTYVKNLPTGAQKICIKAFNSNFSDTKDEDKARQACWGGIKNVYKKVGDKWELKKTKESISEEKQIIYTSLYEAQFDDEKHAVEATIIKKGWSLNKSRYGRRWYTDKAIQSISEKLTENARKMYIDHDLTNKGRSVRDWVATIEESWVEDNKAKAKIVFRSTSDGQALYEDCKRWPELVGISINGEGTIRKGQIDEQNATIIDDITELDSADFVTVPAAGGKVERIAAGVNMDILNETLLTLDDELEKLKSRSESDKLLILWNALRTLVEDLLNSQDKESEDDIKKAIKKGLNDFYKKFTEFDLNLLKYTYLYASVDDLPDEQRELALNELQGIYKKLGVKSEEMPPELRTKESVMTLEELRKDEPNVYEQLEVQMKAVKEQELKNEIDTSNSEKSKVQEELDKIKKELKEAQVELDNYHDKEKADKKAEMIETLLKEKGIKDKVSEKFTDILKESDEETIKKLVEDKADTLKELEGKVQGLNSKDEPTGKKSTREERLKFVKKE